MYSPSQTETGVEPKARATVDDIRGHARRIQDDVRQAAGAVKSDIEDLANQAGRQARQMADSAEHSVEIAAATVLDKIYEKPVKASLIALGTGLVLGFLLRR